MDKPKHAAIDELIAAFYAAFDNRGAQLPTTAEVRRMFLPNGRVTRVSPDGVESWTVDEFIAPRLTMLKNGTLVDFHEWEIEAETTVLGNIANRQSRYGKAGTLHGAPYCGEGRKFVQLCRVGDHWQIISVLWEDL
ncbi:hypothetical protein [Dyella subtropica]|uniref:hypothetical protein n=1 Tax=Dyella subtropica TaxID=2992127 RepID=UPI002258B318|nr:hypothetical protein [Dyella subtropica]